MLRVTLQHLFHFLIIFWHADKSIERDVCIKLTNNISVFLLSVGNMNGSLGDEKCCEHKPQLVNQ